MANTSSVKLDLLSTNNSKILKGSERYSPFVLHLAPHNLSGFNTCQSATPGCSAACLNTTGNARFNTVQAARVRKTRMLFEKGAQFMRLLRVNIDKALDFAKASGDTAVFRLNGTSDLPWQTMRHYNAFDGLTVLEYIHREGGIVYDYTARLMSLKTAPSFYHLTFSRKENNDSDVAKAIALGFNVSVVVEKKLKAQLLADESLASKVVDGDVDDLRFEDRSGALVLLSAKGKAQTDKSGFTILTRTHFDEFLSNIKAAA